jgi:galactose mutarotase-like enzyme
MITLQAGESRADIAVLGAELVRWSAAGREMLWTPDARWWQQTCPILFPVVGATNGQAIRVDGIQYPCAVHGFAAQSRFTVLAQDDASATLELVANAATRAVYPFDFRLRARYRLGRTSMRVELEVENPGTVALPYSLGLHPGFIWPLDGTRDRHSVVFEKPEVATVQVPDAARLVTAQRRTIPMQGTTLPLSDALFGPGGVCLFDAASRALEFRHPDGTALALGFEDMPHIVLWTRPGAPMLCIEGWTGHADPAGFTGDITEKPSIRMLPPGAMARHAMTMARHAMTMGCQAGCDAV